MPLLERLSTPFGNVGFSLFVALGFALATTMYWGVFLDNPIVAVSLILGTSLSAAVSAVPVWLAAVARRRAWVALLSILFPLGLFVGYSLFYSLGSRLGLYSISRPIGEELIGAFAYYLAFLYMPLVIVSAVLAIMTYWSANPAVNELGGSFAD